MPYNIQKALPRPFNQQQGSAKTLQYTTRLCQDPKILSNALQRPNNIRKGSAKTLQYTARLGQDPTIYIRL